MRRASFADMNCSIARSLEIIGEWWTPLILRDAFLGVTRFDDFQARLGIARNILSARLDTLVEAGVMERRTYDEARHRSNYVLTDMGRALWPMMTALRQWGDEWILGRGNAPVVLEHTACGATTEAELVCNHCSQPLELGNVKPVAGPGLRDPGMLRHGGNVETVTTARTAMTGRPRGAAGGRKPESGRRAPTRRAPR